MPPLGYRVDPETMKIKIDENEAKAVRLIFSMADEGKKYPDILAELKSRGFRTKMGKTFTSTSVHDILRNEKYIGICVYNRRVFAVRCEQQRQVQGQIRVDSARRSISAADRP